MSTTTMKTPKKKPGSPLDAIYRRTDLTPEQIFQALGRLRKEAQDQIEFLIDLVNEMDGDTDLEPEPVEANLAGFENCLEAQDEAEIVSEDEGAQCDDEGHIESGIGDFDGLQEQVQGYAGCGVNGFALFVA